MTHTPFDLEAAKAGSPVVTRDGRKVRIVCFDVKAIQPLIALVTEGDAEITNKYYDDGKYNFGRSDSLYDLFMAAPAIPADCVRYDPDVPPPEMAETLEMFYSQGYLIHKDRCDFIAAWKTFNASKPYRTHYRVTKWKLPPDFIPHMGGERPADAVGSGRVCLANGTVVKNAVFTKSRWKWFGAPLPVAGDIIGYLPDEKEKPAYAEIVDRLMPFLNTWHTVNCAHVDKIEEAKDLLNQFAAAIVDAGKK